MSKPAPTVLQTLRAARRKISNFENWIDGGLAFQKNGPGRANVVEVDPWHPGANCFCAVGAISAAMPMPEKLANSDLRFKGSNAYLMVKTSDAGMLLAHVIVGLQKNADVAYRLYEYECGNPIVHTIDVDSVIFHFNDGARSRRKHAMVLEAFDLAILHAKRAGI